MEAELDTLEWRRRVQVALTLLYLAAQARSSGQSLALAVDVLVGSRVRGLPTSLAVVGVILLLAASVNLTREAHRALRSSHNDVSFHRELIARRRADRAGEE